MPSRYESFGLAAFEAMVCKTSLIYTTRAAGPEFVEDGVNGLLVDPDNADEIANAIITLLENRTLNEQIARAGNEFVKANFDIGIIADKHINYYRRVLQQENSRNKRADVLSH